MTSMTEAVIFDMDGLLIDTEPLWRQAEKEIFSNYGIELTGEMAKKNHGLATDEVIMQWYSYKPWPGPDHNRLKNELYHKVYELFTGMKGNGMLREGALQAIESVRSAGLRTAIATSSPRLMIDAFLGKYNLRDQFRIDHTSEDEAYGKPHPAVYLGVASKLGLPPSSCLAVEDSVNGLISARSARMKTIAVPEPSDFDNPQYSIADHKLHSLLELDVSLVRSL